MIVACFFVIQLCLLYENLCCIKYDFGIWNVQSINIQYNTILSLIHAITDVYWLLRFPHFFKYDPVVIL